MKLRNLTGPFFLILASCVGPAPVSEYNFSNIAIEEAKSAGALTYSPGLLNKAEDAYKQAKDYYNEKNYSQAAKFFNKAQKYAEKAELRAKVKKFDKGESL